MELPVVRNFGWTLKTLSSAHTEINNLPSGQIEFIIHHEKINGITIEMLQWWFQKFPYLTVIKSGQKYTSYDLWHPFDHIAVTVDQEKSIVEQGDTININECFQRNSVNYLNEKAIIFYFQKDGFGMQRKLFGKTIMQLLHKFEQVDGGVLYKSRMILGLENGFLKFIVNKYIIPKKFGQLKANAWLRHNVEEVGCFENFLSDLYVRRNQGNQIDLDV